MNPREELVEIILAGLSCVNSSSIHPDGNRCRDKNYGCIWYAEQIADALIPFIERGKAEALRDAGTYLPEFTDSPWGITAAMALDDRADAIEKGTE